MESHGEPGTDASGAISDFSPGHDTRKEGVIRTSETRYRRLFGTAHDGILMLDADSGQIVDVNPYLVRLPGYSHAEFPGKKLWEAGVFKDIAECKKAFETLRKDGYVCLTGNSPFRRFADLCFASPVGEGCAHPTDVCPAARPLRPGREGKKTSRFGNGWLVRIQP